MTNAVPTLLTPGRLAAELGIVLPKVRIRDNLRLPTRVFQFQLYGEVVLRGEAHPDLVLAIGSVPPQISRVPSDLPWAPRGGWIHESDSDILPAGHVFSATQAITESLLWVARKHAADLLSRDATAELLDEARKHHPAAARELSERDVSLARVQRILGGLVREGISIRHLGRIVEMIGDLAPEQSDWAVVERLRLALKRQTSQRLRNELGVIRAMGISDEIAAAFRAEPSALTGPEPPRSLLTAEQLQHLHHSIASGIRHMHQAQMLPVLVVPTAIRSTVAAALEQFLGELFVIGDEEIDAETTCQTIARITAADLAPPTGQAA